MDAGTMERIKADADASMLAADECFIKSLRGNKKMKKKKNKNNNNNKKKKKKKRRRRRRRRTRKRKTTGCQGEHKTAAPMAAAISSRLTLP